MIKTTVKAGEKSKLLAFYLKAAERQDTVGSMERLSKTFKGLASTLSDNIDLALVTFYTSVEGSLKGLVKYATKAAQSFKPLARDFGVFVKLKLPGILDKVRKAMKLIGPLTKTAATFMGLYVSHWVGMKALGVASLIWKMVGALRGLTVVQMLATGWQMALNGAVLLIPALIGAVIIAIGLLALDFAEFMRTGDSTLLRFTDRWPELQDAIKNVYIALDAFGTGLMDMDSTMKWWSENSNIYIDNWKAGWMEGLNAVKIEFFAWVQYLIAKFDLFIIWVKQKWAEFKQSASEAGEAVKQAIMHPLDAISNALAGLPAKANIAFQGLLSAAKTAANAMPAISLGMKISGMAAKAAGFNKGGFVGGSGNTDTVPAVLTPGEFIINKGMAQKLMSGNPKGLSDLSKQMNAPSLASVGSQPMTQQSAGSYSVPSSSVASTNYNITINAPLTQNNNISGMGGSPSDVGTQIGASASARFNRGLSNAARQVPQRVSRA